MVLAAVALCGILIRLLGWLPWKTGRAETEAPVRSNFLLVLAAVMLAVIFLGFWFAMK
jgi:hypothetical protein